MILVLATVALDFLLFAGLLGIAWAYFTEGEETARVSPAWIAVLIGICALWDVHVVPAVRVADVELLIHNPAIQSVFGMTNERIRLIDLTQPSPFDAVWWVLQGAIAYGVGLALKRRARSRTSS